MTRSTGDHPVVSHLCPMTNTVLTVRLRGPARDGTSGTCTRCLVTWVYRKPVVGKHIAGVESGGRSHF